MHIALVSSSFPTEPGDPGGHFVLAEAKELARQGHDVTVLAPSAGRPRDLGAGAPRVIDLPHAGLFGWPGALWRARARPWRASGAPLFVRAARAELARLRVDRVIAHFIVPCGWPIALTQRAPLEVVAHGSDVRLLERAPRALRDHILGKLIQRGATFRFVSSELLERLARASAPCLRARSHVQPCAIDVTGAPDRAQARRRLRVAPEQRLVVIASRLVKSKRVETALSAAALIGPARCVVFGDGPERRSLQQAFPAAEFRGLVPRPMLLCWVAAADVVLNASRLEGAPSIVREARALGVPVVSVPCGDLAQLAAEDPDLFVCR